MSPHDARPCSRREFLGGVTLAGAAGLVGVTPALVGAEPPPETAQIRLFANPGICVAPQYVAEELLRSEGFTEVHYVKFDLKGDVHHALASGEIDISMAFVAPFLLQVDKGLPITLLGGVHVGCFEVFGTDRVRTIRDLKGKTIAVPVLESGHHVFLASIAAYVGVDPRQDITWVTTPTAESMQLLAEGKIDALIGFPPVSQELRAKQIAHVVLNSGLDKPWSQYFCCIVGSNREFVRRHPVATKRALRAILKAANLCALEPERAAQVIADKGYKYDYALQTMQEIPYSRWHEYDPRRYGALLRLAAA
jgi:NitT/TauT family transport system substrate-binding protein